MPPEIARLLGAIKGTAAARSSFVDAAETRIAQMRAAIILEWQDRTVIEQHAAMAGTAGASAFNTRQLYHNRHTDSAAIDALMWTVSEVIAEALLMAKFRQGGVRSRRAEVPRGDRITPFSPCETPAEVTARPPSHLATFQ